MWGFYLCVLDSKVLSRMCEPVWALLNGNGLSSAEKKSWCIELDSSRLRLKMFFGEMNEIS
jgi:hypothetical protein